MFFFCFVWFLFAGASKRRNSFRFPWIPRPVQTFWRGRGSLLSRSGTGATLAGPARLDTPPQIRWSSVRHGAAVSILLWSAQRLRVAAGTRQFGKRVIRGFFFRKNFLQQARRRPVFQQSGPF